MMPITLPVTHLVSNSFARKSEAVSRQSAVANWTGIDASDIGRKLAREYAATRPAVIRPKLWCTAV